MFMGTLLKLFSFTVQALAEYKVYLAGRTHHDGQHEVL